MDDTSRQTQLRWGAWLIGSGIALMLLQEIAEFILNMSDHARGFSFPFGLVVVAIGAGLLGVIHYVKKT
jgi:hypothetical protein